MSRRSRSARIRRSSAASMASEVETPPRRPTAAGIRSRPGPVVGWVARDLRAAREEDALDVWTPGVWLLLLGLAAANGANDTAKGVATLAGAGVTRYRTAL